MAYPLINGAEINGSEESTGIGSAGGLALGKAGQATAVSIAYVAGSTPIQIPGAAGLKTYIAPPGLNLLTAGTPMAVYQALLRPAGLNLLTAGAPSLDISVFPESAKPFVFGANRAQLGTDVVLYPPGMDLVRDGWHSIERGMPGANQAATAVGQVALRIGGAAVEPATMAFDVAGSTPLVFGQSGAGRYVMVGGSRPIAIGTPSIRVTSFAQPATALRIGGASIQISIRPPGIRLGKAGVPTALASGSEVWVDGAHALVFGAPRGLKMAAYARPARPIRFGPVQIDRGTAC